MHGSEFERHIAAIASLHEPARRGLYLYVAGRRRDVGRDEAARALRISRALAAFHLDKLVQQGLLETSYRRLTGRRGPGAGRPAKLYRRSIRQVDFTLPRRRYELAGRLLAQALTAAGSPAARRMLRRLEDHRLPLIRVAEGKSMLRAPAILLGVAMHLVRRGLQTLFDGSARIRHSDGQLVLLFPAHDASRARICPA